MPSESVGISAPPQQPLLVVAALPEEPLPERFSILPLLSTAMIVICRKTHPLYRGGGEATLDDLAAFGMIGFMEDREFEKKSKRTLGTHADKLHPVLQTTSLTVMFGIFAATDYFAIVSSLMLPRARREGLEQLPVKHDFWHLDIDLMCKSSISRSRPVSAITEALCVHASSVGEPRLGHPAR